MKLEQEIDEKLVKQLLELFPDRTIDEVIVDSLHSYIAQNALLKLYEREDKPVVDNWGSSHYVEPK